MKKKYEIGYTCGVFDVFHIGHLNLLERCKAQCDTLIIGCCDDMYVRKIKKKEPVMQLEERMRILSALRCVDKVIPVTIEEIENKMIVWENIHFNVLFSGDDWKGSERYKKTEEEFKAIGVYIEYLPYTKGISTTQLKEKIKICSEN